MTIFDASRLVVGKAEGPGSGIAHLVDREVGTEGGYLSGTLVDKESHLTTLVLAQGEAAAVVGIRLIDLQAVIDAFSITYLILVLVVVRGVALGAGIGGQLVGFYPIESAITAGLCTTNMGGTGDIAVLSAADRMVLLPFAQISTRICGALVLVVASLLVRVLF